MNHRQSLSRTVRVVRMIANVLATAVLVTAFPNPALSQAAQNPPGRSAKERPAGTVVNINTASATELQTLPGVGAATATRILEYRQKNGGFKKVEDIMNVRGIGEKTFLKLKPLITITPPKVTSL